MATSSELKDKRDLITQLESRLSEQKASGASSAEIRLLEEELRRQYQELENLQR